MVERLFLEANESVKVRLFLCALYFVYLLLFSFFCNWISVRAFYKCTRMSVFLSLYVLLLVSVEFPCIFCLFSVAGLSLHIILAGFASLKSLNQGSCRPLNSLKSAGI